MHFGCAVAVPDYFTKKEVDSYIDRIMGAYFEFEHIESIDETGDVLALLAELEKDRGSWDELSHGLGLYADSVAERLNLIRIEDGDGVRYTRAANPRGILDSWSNTSETAWTFGDGHERIRVREILGNGALWDDALSTVHTLVVDERTYFDSGVDYKARDLRLAALRHGYGDDWLELVDEHMEANREAWHIAVREELERLEQAEPMALWMFDYHD